MRSSLKLLKAIEAEQSLEVFEDILSEDPLLAYRFMVYTNSASLGLRTGIDSLRRGLVMMGYGSIKRWLSDQLPHASTEASLHPVREASVLRARLTEHLLESGVQNDLRREVYLCGLFSQLDELLREPWAPSCTAFRCPSAFLTPSCCTPAPTPPAWRWPAPSKPRMPAPFANCAKPMRWTSKKSTAPCCACSPAWKSPAPATDFGRYWAIPPRAAM